METPPAPKVSPEIQRARSLLAELCEIGVLMMGREQHLEVLLAYDDLDRSTTGLGPPPNAAEGIVDALAALREARANLVVALEDPEAHDIEPLAVALAVEHIDLSASSGS